MSEHQRTSPQQQSTFMLVSQCCEVGSGASTQRGRTHISNVLLTQNLAPVSKLPASNPTEGSHVDLLCSTIAKSCLTNFIILFMLFWTMARWPGQNTSLDLHLKATEKGTNSSKIFQVACHLHILFSKWFRKKKTQPHPLGEEKSPQHRKKLHPNSFSCSNPGGGALSGELCS